MTQMTPEDFRDFLIRMALHRALLDNGGIITLFPEDLDTRPATGLARMQLAFQTLHDPERVIIRLLTPERFKELQDMGAPEI